MSAQDNQHNQYDHQCMQRALALALNAQQTGEVPVGAVLVKAGEVIAEGFNQPIALSDPSAHAEMIALRQAAKHLGNYRLENTTMYVTLEPCAMCLGAMMHARIERLVFAASDTKTGVVGGCCNLTDFSCFNHRIKITSGVLAEESSTLLRAFFKARR